MEIIIKTKNLGLSESVKVLVDKKMKSLEKLIKVFSKGEQKLFVEVEKETKHHRKGDIFKAEVSFQVPGANLMAKAYGEDLAMAIVQARQELEREVRKYKAKTIELPRRKYRKVKKEFM